MIEGRFHPVKKRRTGTCSPRSEKSKNWNPNRDRRTSRDPVLTRDVTTEGVQKSEPYSVRRPKVGTTIEKTKESNVNRITPLRAGDIRRTLVQGGLFRRKYIG